MPQPEDVEFEQPAQEELITEKTELAKAKAGPDIHCYYCGSRNSADAKTCAQCGADLTEGAKRSSDRVMGAHRTEPAAKINCPACGTPNEASAPKCVQCGASLVETQPEPAPPTPVSPPVKESKRRGGLLGKIAIIAVVLLICGACITFFVLSNRTEDVSGSVQDVSWTRSIAIEELVPVTHEDWRDQIPVGAIVGTCIEKVHHTETRSSGETREICGTPYTVDTGSGAGEVVQDCEYEEIMEEVEVFADSCEYTIDEWQQVDRVALSGNDLNPEWPDPRLNSYQREGESEETYKITFNTEDGQYTFTTSKADLFAQAQIGSRWILQVNTFNAVTSIAPK
jgi:DNA-directed RNA polymerase subunit RPC12/RpoP